MMRRPRSVRRTRRVRRLPLRRAPRSRSVTGLVMGQRKFVRLNFQTFIPNPSLPLVPVAGTAYAPGSPAYPQYGGFQAGNQIVWYPMSATPDLTNASGLPVVPAAGQNLWNGLTEFAQYYGNARLHSCTIRVRLTVDTFGSSGDNLSVRAALIALPMTLDGSNAYPANTPNAISRLTWAQLRSAPGVRTCVLGTLQGSGSTRTLRASGTTKRMFDKGDIRDDPTGANNVQLSGTLDSADWRNPNNVWAFVLNLYSDDPNNNANGALVAVDAKLTGVWELYNRILITEVSLTS